MRAPHYLPVPTVLAGLVLAGLCVVPVALALDLESLPTRPASRLDTLRARAAEARLGGDAPRGAILRDAILREFPGDGHTLREIALEARLRAGLAQLSKELAVGKSPHDYVSVDLSAADRAYLHGLVEFYRSRVVSATASLDEALKQRPNWGWALFYRGRSGYESMDSARASDAYIERALADSDVVPTIAGWLLLSSRPSAQALATNHERELMELAGAIPWSAWSAETRRIRRRFRDGPMTFAQCESLWTHARSKLGVTRASDIALELAHNVQAHIPPHEAMQFMRDRIADGDAPEGQWHIALGNLLAALGFKLEAQSLLIEAPLQTEMTRSHLMELGLEYLSPDQLRTDVARAIDESLDSRTISNANYVLSQLGDDAAISRVNAERSAQNPRGEQASRLADLMTSDLSAAVALLDSLESSPAGAESFTWEAFTLSEDMGDTLNLEQLRRSAASSPPYRIAAASRSAYLRGNMSRANRLAPLALAEGEKSVTFLMWYAGLLQAGGLATSREDVGRRLGELCWGCPLPEWQVIGTMLTSGKLDEVRSRIRSLAAGDISLSLMLSLVYSSENVGEPGLADTLLDRAVRRAPNRRGTRRAQAWIAVRRGALAEARGLLEPLKMELPGDTAVQGLVVAAGGSIDATPRATAAAGPFASFEQDLESSSWIRERAAKVKGTETAPLTYLRRQTTYACDSPSRCQVRKRRTFRVNTQIGADYNKTTRLSFYPSEGTPTVRVARVVKPDGTVHEVDPREIVISAAEDTEVDVSDKRDLVIPFAGVEVGSVVDIVWEQSTGSMLGVGWSFREFLQYPHPAQEAVVEMRVRTGFPVQLHEGPGCPPAETTVGAVYTMRRWVTTDQPPALVGANTGSPYERYPWVGASSFESWDHAISDYYGEFWSRVDVSDEIRGVASRISKGRSTPAEKVSAVHEFVSKNVEYIAIELGAGRVIPTSASEVLRRGYGDCKDMVALFVALLGELGVEARPVLLSSSDRAEPLASHVEPNVFSHMIAWVPSTGSGVFCDVTAGSPCPEELPAMLAGVHGLIFERDGSTSLIQLPEPTAQDHGFHMAYDVRPAPDHNADVDVQARFRGDLANIIRRMVQVPDTSFVGAAVDRYLAWGLPATSVRRTWTLVENACDRLVLQASYSDTASSIGRHSFALPIYHEVADPFMSFEAPSDTRKHFVFDHLYSDTVLIRLHPGAAWEVVNDIATLTLDKAGWKGRVQTRRPSAGVLEVQHTFAVQRQSLSESEYDEFYKDWLRFLTGVYQPYRYRRALDEQHLISISRFASEHPADASYRMQAALELLGDDLGGDGESGLRRRDLCRELIGPLTANPAAGVWPHVLLASIDIQDGRVHRADSLLAIAVELEPTNMIVLPLATAAREAVGDREGARGLLERIAATLPGNELQITMLMMLYRDGLDDKAHDVETRYFSLNPGVDSTEILQARFLGHLQSGNCTKAAPVLDRLRGLLDDATMQALTSSFALDCGDVYEAARIFQETWLEDPLDPLRCNNLAWSYARLGTNLDLAEELAQNAIRLSLAKSASVNTLGAIYIRQGRWDDARKSFQYAMDIDESQETRIVNTYFLGLCDYETGDREEALRKWRAAGSDAPPSKWATLIERSVARAEKDEPVLPLLFEGME